MRAPLAAGLVLLSLTGLASQAQAAGTSTTTYSVTLLPDPSPNATNADCTGTVGPMSHDIHPYTVPGKGTLTVELDAGLSGAPADPTDWDLDLLDAAGGLLSESAGDTAVEALYDLRFTKKTKVQIATCNLAGQPKGTVTIRFKASR